MNVRKKERKKERKDKKSEETYIFRQFKGKIISKALIRYILKSIDNKNRKIKTNA